MALPANESENGSPVDLAKFGMKIEEALADKKLSWTEAVSLGVFAMPKVMEYASDAEAIKNEIKDLSAIELEDLVDCVAESLDLENDKVEALIEAGLDWALSTQKLVKAAKDALGKE